MSDILGNGVVTFGDGTSLSSAVIPWTNFTSRPTQLSQFTNDLGNYGAFLTTTANVFTGDSGYGAGNEFDNPNGTVNACGSGRGGIGHLTSGVWSLTWNGTYPGLAVYNCNCACNC